IVNRLRSIKKQLLARNELLQEDAKTEKGIKTLVKESKTLLSKLEALEEKLHNPRAEVVYDILAQKGGAKLYSQLSTLYKVATGADGAPTQGVREVHEERAAELRQLAKEFQAVVTNDLKRLNETATQLDVPGVIAPKAAKAVK